jgi:signal transduction histidine kinase
MRDFLAVASHDLRTPLTLIQGFAGVLESQWDALPDHQKREHIGTISRQARLLTRLVNDLLTVSRIDSGALELNKEVLDVAAIVIEAVEGIETEGHPPRIDAPVGLMVGADGDHLRRILRNFVHNAFTYGEPPVEIEAHQDGEWVEVRVRDRGNGVPDEFRPHLFEKFSRSDEAKAKARTGTGLGLSIARGLAEANGGEVWYEANDGEGACFAIRLPRESRPSGRE